MEPKQTYSIIISALLIVGISGCVNTAHQKLQSLFDIDVKHPFPLEEVRHAVLKKLPPGTTEDDISAYLKKHGIPESGRKRLGGNTSHYVRSEEAARRGMDKNMLHLLVIPEGVQVVPSQTYWYYIKFQLDAERSLTNIVVSGQEEFWP